MVSDWSRPKIQTNHDTGNCQIVQNRGWDSVVVVTSLCTFLLYVLCLVWKLSSHTPSVVHRRAILRAGAYLLSFISTYLIKAAQDFFWPSYDVVSETTWCFFCLSGFMNCVVYASQIGGGLPELGRNQGRSSSQLSFDVTFSLETPELSKSAQYFDLERPSGRREEPLDNQQVTE
eukprot:CAMPEP_0194523250 /NCGR_PEP_ID=MMETSP0253-20130528/58099_1 /TAXON_ID=2966 /ORGANISM="Noctiluca scintillans" /LENGTH=174 /DNA_ID=CAMNT_0039367773 /DNA_START=370 /DNA_END=894 /DNA_ORIENTATION=-